MKLVIADEGEREVSVALVGVREILLDETWIGSVVDDAKGTWVVGPIYMDRLSRDEVIWLSQGENIQDRSFPRFDTWSDSLHSSIEQRLRRVADVLNVPLRLSPTEGKSG